MTAPAPSLGLTQECPAPAAALLALGLWAPSIKPPAANGDAVIAAITWKGPVRFRAASLPSLINGHFNGKGNKNCIFHTMQ